MLPLYLNVLLASIVFVSRIFEPIKTDVDSISLVLSLVQVILGFGEPSTLPQDKNAFESLYVVLFWIGSVNFGVKPMIKLIYNDFFSSNYWFYFTYYFY